MIKQEKFFKLYMSEDRKKLKINTLLYYCEIKIKEKDTFFDKGSYCNKYEL